MVDAKNEQGRVVIISGPSGVGKSTICKELVKRLDNVFLSVSVTTRPRGENEVDGEDYLFITRRDFEQRIKKGLLLEWAEVFGNLYGTSKDKIEQALGEGKTVILEIDVQGARKAKLIYPQAVMIFILPPSRKDLVERISGRGRDQTKAAELRLNGAGTEIAEGWKYYENMVINEDLEQAVTEVIEIINQQQTKQQAKKL